MSHQEHAYAAPACLPTDDQGSNSHHRSVVLQHPAKMTRDEADDPLLRDCKKNRIGSGLAELPDVFYCLVRRNRVSQLL